MGFFVYMCVIGHRQGNGFQTLYSVPNSFSDCVKVAKQVVLFLTHVKICVKWHCSGKTGFLFASRLSRLKEKLKSLR